MKFPFPKISRRLKTPSGAKERQKESTVALFQDGLAVVIVGGLLVFSAAARGVNLLLALGAFFVGFLVVDYFWGTRSLKKLKARRKLPETIYAREPFYVEIELDATERKNSSWAIVVEDEWGEEEAAFDAPEALKKLAAKNDDERKSREMKRKTAKNKNEKKKSAVSSDKEKADSVEVALREGDPTTRPVAYFPAIRAGETIKEYYVGVMTRRGRRTLNALTISTRFPCGFFRSSVREEVPDETLVFPKTGRLTAEWDAYVGSLAQESSVATSAIARSPDETVSIRDWRVGDSKRTIAWRASAKRDRLQTREFAKRQTRALSLILDLYDPNPDAIQSDPQRWLRVETAISFVATLVDRWTTEDARLEFALNGELVDDADGEIEASATRREWNEIFANGSTRRVMTRLALARATSRDSLREYLDEAVVRNARDARIFVVSTSKVDSSRLGDESANPASIGAQFIDVSSQEFLSFFQLDASRDA